MIEVVRACMGAETLVEHSEFLWLGTIKSYPGDPTQDAFLVRDRLRA